MIFCEMSSFGDELLDPESRYQVPVHTGEVMRLETLGLQMSSGRRLPPEECRPED